TVERLSALDEGGRPCGELQAERRAAQLLQPSLDAALGAPLRVRAERPDHGDRHRRRALEGRPRGRAADDRERRGRLADAPRVGRRPRRDRRTQAPLGAGPALRLFRRGGGPMSLPPPEYLEYLHELMATARIDVPEIVLPEEHHVILRRMRF